MILSPLSIFSFLLSSNATSPRSLSGLGLWLNTTLCLLCSWPLAFGSRLMPNSHQGQRVPLKTHNCPAGLPYFRRLALLNSSLQCFLPSLNRPASQPSDDDLSHLTGKEKSLTRNVLITSESTPQPAPWLPCHTPLGTLTSATGGSQQQRVFCFVSPHSLNYRSWLRAREPSTDRLFRI